MGKENSNIDDKIVKVILDNFDGQTVGFIDGKTVGKKLGKTVWPKKKYETNLKNTKMFLFVF